MSILRKGEGAMISNQILQSNIEGLKEITRIDLCVCDVEGKVLASTFEHAEEFFEKVGMRDKVDYDPNSGKTYLHPGRQANMVYDGKVVGYLGEVHPLVADTYGIGDKAYVAVIDILTVLEFASFNHKYTGIAKYPAVTRDLSMVVPKTVLAGQIEHILTQRGGKILESYQLFDIYEGNQIKGGYKSMAYSLVFRHHDKTLEESEITAAMKKILNGLTDLGIELRS